MKWESSRLWTFTADMSGDGRTTIGDVWLWVKWLYLYPGDCFIYGVGNSGVGQFFEMGPDNLGGVVSFVILAFAWVIAFATIALMNLDIWRRLHRVWRWIVAEPD
jgi:hypothetical protein